MAEIPFTILIDQTIADEIAKKNMAELVLRRTDATYRSFIKCAIDHSAGSEKEVLQTAMSVATNNSLSMDQINSIMSPIRNGLVSGQNKLNHIVSIARNNALNIDSVLKSTQVIKFGTFLNTGLELANIGITIAGFVMMSRKLNLLDEELKKALNMLDAAEKRDRNRFYAEYHKLVMLTNKALDSIRLNQINLDDLETLIISLNTFVENCVNDIKSNSRNIGDMLKMIFSLITPYTAVLKAFLTEYYYKNHIFPGNYSSFLGLYDLLLDPGLLKTEFNYMFLDQDMTNRDTISTLDTQMALIIDARTLITDYKELLEVFKTKENMGIVEDEINESVTSRSKEIAPEIAAQLQVSPKYCEQVLAQARSLS